LLGIASKRSAWLTSNCLSPSDGQLKVIIVDFEFAMFLYILGCRNKVCQRVEVRWLYDYEVVAVVRQERPLDSVAIGSLKTTKGLVAYEQGTDGNRIERSGSALILHGTYIAVLIEQEYTEVVGCCLTLQFLNGFDDRLADGTDNTSERGRLTSDDLLNTTECFIATAKGTGSTSLYRGSLDVG
jgi:hypothetical protein